MLCRITQCRELIDQQGDLFAEPIPDHDVVVWLAVVIVTMACMSIAATWLHSEFSVRKRAQLTLLQIVGCASTVALLSFL